MATAARKKLLDQALEAHRGGRADEARRTYATYLSRAPKDAGAWSNYGALLRAEGRIDQALRAHRRAHALDPNTPAVLNNYANVLGDVGEAALCVELRQRIMAMRSTDAAAQKAQIGRAWRCVGEYGRAIAVLDKALEEHPGDAEIETQLAFALLGDGQYERGFSVFEARWRQGELKPPQLPVPKWRGERLDGKSVLVVPEQGHGDTVLMMRFLPRLTQRAANVAYMTKPGLERLLANREGASAVVPGASSSAPIDVYLSAMDLPKLGLRGRDNIPPPTGLSLPEDSLELARARVSPFPDKFRIGVNWSGSPTYKGNAFRSFSHRELLPLSDHADVQLFSLYKGPMIEAYRRDGADGFIIDSASSDRDFADCAALISKMDLIITSDTATAHIAGSLGMPTWVVLHWDAYWIYSHVGDTTPWYPSMRLFRQEVPRDWTGVFAQVERALGDQVAEWRKGRQRD